MKIRDTIVLEVIFSFASNYLTKILLVKEKTSEKLNHSLCDIRKNFPSIISPFIIFIVFLITSHFTVKKENVNCYWKNTAQFNELVPN